MRDIGKCSKELYPETVSNDDNSKLLMNYPADVCICGRINACSSLIQDKDLVLLEKRSGKNNKLLLASRQAKFSQP